MEVGSVVCEAPQCTVRSVCCRGEVRVCCILLQVHAIPFHTLSPSDTPTLHGGMFSIPLHQVPNPICIYMRFLPSIQSIQIPLLIPEMSLDDDGL